MESESFKLHLYNPRSHKLPRHARTHSFALLKSAQKRSSKYTLASVDTPSRSTKHLYMWSMSAQWNRCLEKRPKTCLVVTDLEGPRLLQLHLCHFKYGSLVRGYISAYYVQVSSTKLLLIKRSFLFNSDRKLLKTVFSPYSHARSEGDKRCRCSINFNDGQFVQNEGGLF